MKTTKIELVSPMKCLRVFEKAKEPSIVITTHATTGNSDGVYRYVEFHFHSGMKEVQDKILSDSKPGKHLAQIEAMKHGSDVVYVRRRHDGVLEVTDKPVGIYWSLKGMIEGDPEQLNADRTTSLLPAGWPTQFSKRIDLSDDKLCFVIFPKINKPNVCVRNYKELSGAESLQLVVPKLGKDIIAQFVSPDDTPAAEIVAKHGPNKFFLRRINGKLELANKPFGQFWDFNGQLKNPEDDDLVRQLEKLPKGW